MIMNEEQVTEASFSFCAEEEVRYANCKAVQVECLLRFSARGAGSVAFSSSGKTLLAGFWDGSLRAFSVKKLTVLLYLDFHSESISQILWTKVNDEDRVAVASSDEKLSLWVF
ncbi:unnamed protein product [Heligmosomoides polygyrus]|uniref:WD_REPEATS_REGION domain-containing protein n=1 Tax=Heligmosomoides polygyrus TaxID=6339 RepID=A0A183GGF6_HELPZ|nr:unnamed protein product [Heligmosomoides polygyrus]